MTKNIEFNYWMPDEKDRVSYAFADHVRMTAEATDRPAVPETFFDIDAFGRVNYSELAACVDKSNIDFSFTFDCASRISGVLLQQIGAMINAAPNLDTALDVLISTISYYDDRIIACKSRHKDKTNFCMFYKRAVNADFLHIQAGALFLTALDAWPAHYIDNSTFNFPRVTKGNKQTLKSIMSGFSWVDIETGKLPMLSWTIDTEKLQWPAPNFNPEWWEHSQKFLRSGLDGLSTVEKGRNPWCRFTTAAMLTDPKNMTAEKACYLAGVSNKTLSKKLASEGYNAAALKTWILKEFAMRCMAAKIPEELYAAVFGYTLPELRASLKRRGIENPYLMCQHSKERLRQELQSIDRTYPIIERQTAKIRSL